MIRRFARDESGMAMAVAIFMVLLIGVMGAGLLTFVMSDTKSVLEVNKGQKAMDVAEAGVQAAKAHLRVDSFREHYDTVSSNDCAEGPRTGGENWSRATDIYTNTNGLCVGPSTRTAAQVGVTRNFAGGKFHVTIECFRQSGDATGSAAPCNGGAADSNPMLTIPASDRKFFKVTSTGYDNTAGDWAKRKIEAVYTTAKKTYAPIAFWTPKNIEFRGSSAQTVTKMSFFAGNYITGIGGITRNTSFPTLYGDWRVLPYNETPRVKNPADSAPIANTPGFAAVNRVCNAQGSTCSTSDADGYRDYDSTTGSKGQMKTFVASATTPASQITFPFNPGNAIADPSSIVDPGLVEEMRVAAEDQGNYFCPTCPNPNQITGAKTISTWPAQGATVFVDAGGNTVTYAAVSTPKPAGMLIVRNGNVQMSNTGGTRAGFQGVIIVIGNGTTTGTYEQGGQVGLDGYVAASGNMLIRGGIDPNTSLDFTNLNSFYDIKLWSWRELYS